MKKLFTLLVASSFGSLAFGQVVSTYPYTEDFEAEATCPTGCGAVCNTLIDWNNPTTDDLDWLVDNSGTSSSGTGPTANGGADHTTGVAGGNYVYVETSCSGTGYTNKRADLESPWFDFSSGLNMQLEFWYHAFGATQGPLNVEARVGMNGTWANIAGPIQDDQDVWQEWSGCFGPTYAGADSVQIRFVYVSGTSFTGDIALDDISIAQVAQNDVGATIVSGPAGCGLDTAEVITVEVCNFGDTVLAGTMIPVYYTVDGGTPVMETLTLSGDLLDICNGGGCETYTFSTTADLSAPGIHTLVAWTALAGDPAQANDTTTSSVNNIPVGGTLPYFINFEAGQGNWVIDQGTNGTWAFGTPAKVEIAGAASGDSCFIAGGLTGTYNANEASNVTSPCLDISAATGAEVVTLKINVSTENSWDGANLFASVDGGVTWSQQGSFGDPFNWYDDNTISGAPNGSQEGWTGDFALGTNGWVCASNDLDSAMMVDNSAIIFRVGFGSDGSVQREGFGFDDFAVGLPITYAGALPDSINGLCDTSYAADGGANYVWHRWDHPATGSVKWGQMVDLDIAGDWNLTVSDSLGMCAMTSIYVDLLDFINPSLSDIYVCPGDSAMFDAEGVNNVTYAWSNGDTTQTTWLFAPGTISVTKVDTVTGCMATDSAMLINAAPVSLNDITMCDGDTAMIDGTIMNGTYTWSTGDTVAMISTTTAGTFYVDAVDTVLGCASSDTMMVNLWANPMPNLGADVADCDMTTLDAGAGFAGYSWSTGGSAQTEDVTASGSVMVTVTDTNGCMGMDTIDVTINVSPTVNLGADQTICINASTTLDAGNAGATYAWGGGETTQTIVVDGSTVGVGTFNYDVTVTDGNGCSGTDMVTVTVDSCLSVEENLMGVTLSVYPNPTNGQLFIDVEDLNQSDLVLTVLSLQGQALVSEQINNSNPSYTVNLNLEALAAGVYFLRFENSNGVALRKVVIQ